MRDDAWRSYEEWRRLWLAGKDGHAVSMLRFHGLRAALELLGSVHGPPEPPLSTSVPVAAKEIPVGDAVLAEAARQIRRVMGLATGFASRQDGRACPN